MRIEFNCIHKNKTWVLTAFIKGQERIAMQIVYKYKYTIVSASPKYKAHIVAKGFKQEHEVDYDEIF